jgi:pimeloyl-ACP methyl ester carboxylesterase
VHRDAPGWAEALGSYFASGGYQARVGPPLIRRVRQPSLVVWGSDDPVLPMRDAYAFERDLPGCVGVRLVPGAGHTPQLEDPDAVALLIAQFARELGA